jgi:hypothetical protein
MKETKWIILALVALLSLSLSAMVACDDDDDDDDDDDNDDGGGAVAACNAYLEECGGGLGAEYCDAYADVALAGECWESAVIDYFNCLLDNDCADPDSVCSDDYLAALDACY